MKSVDVGGIGFPSPFGVTKREGGYNFAVMSKNGTDVALLISIPGSDPLDPFIFPLDPHENRTGDIWHILISGLPPVFYYAYTIDGPWDPPRGHIYDKGKALIDPFAKALYGMEIWRVRGESVRILGQYLDTPYDWTGDRSPDIDINDLIIYETHVRGFTQHPSSNTRFAGCFAGMAEKLGYLKDLGINAIELLPINEFDELDCDYVNPVNDERLVNYWGYDSINFFALKTGYASGESALEAMTEFKDFVKACHGEGIEVILDVVFNHTGEGDKTRRTLSFKGIDNQIYYILDDTGEYHNFSGCGNTLNCNHPVVSELLISVLRYWVTEYHIDGFRFDLASALTRRSNGTVMSDPPVIESIAKDPLLSRVKIIAEAWDASGLYQVGTFPAYQRWMEWNDKYRDIARRFVRGETGLAGEMATRIAGSEDLYGPSGRSPFHSVNFITAHDGFTMMDLVSYQAKHNQANGEDNQDGSDENYSYNFGVEGPSSDHRIVSSRSRQIRNMATLLMLSQGVPMIRSGDEFGQTQLGNNNAWCQDNELSWLDWRLTRRNDQLFRFWKRLIAFRKRGFSFGRRHFFTGEINEATGLADISWHGRRVNQPEFGDKSNVLAFLIDGTVAGDPEVYYVAMNFSDDTVDMELPPVDSIYPWCLVLRTDAPERFIDDEPEELSEDRKSYDVQAKSVVVLTKKV